MAYLGNVPAQSFISFERQVFTIVNSQTAYTLSHSVTNENDIRLVVNNVVQEPGSGKAYTASGTTLTLSAALTNGTDEMYCVFLGRAVGTVNAPAGSVGTSQLAADAVTSAKLATLTSAMDFQGVASDMRLNFDTTDTVANATPLMAITAKNKTDSVAQISMRRESAVDDGYIALSTQATGGAVTETVRIHSNGVMSASAGVALGVGTANTASNVLDDYEEGTWTPTFTSGGNTLSFSGGTETYTYTKIGNTCQLRFNIQNCTTSGTTATGDNRITIPFNGAANLRQVTAVINYHTSGGLRYTGADVLTGEIGSNSSFIQLQEWVNNSGYRNISSAPSTGANTYFWFTITYQTA